MLESNLTLKMMFGRVEKWADKEEERKRPWHFLKRVKRRIGDTVRDNAAYLKRWRDHPFSLC